MTNALRIGPTLVNGSSTSARRAPGLCASARQKRAQFLANFLMCDRSGRRHRLVLGQMSRLPPNAPLLTKFLAESLSGIAPKVSDTAGAGAIVDLASRRIAADRIKFAVAAPTQTIQLRGGGCVCHDHTNFAHHRIGLAPRLPRSDKSPRNSPSMPAFSLLCAGTTSVVSIPKTLSTLELASCDRRLLAQHSWSRRDALVQRP